MNAKYAVTFMMKQRRSGNGIAPGTKWEDVPEDWVCPLCSVGKDQFKEA